MNVETVGHSTVITVQGCTPKQRDWIDKELVREGIRAASWAPGPDVAAWLVHDWFTLPAVRAIGERMAHAHP